MTADAPTSTTLESARNELATLLANSDLCDERVLVLGSPLTPEEAIGSPGRRDYPILVGRERVVEASLAGCRGQAFTDAPMEFSGRLGELLSLPLTTNGHRALFVATLNATLCALGLLPDSLHCRDDEPERCGENLVQRLRNRSPEATVGLVGLNPALAHHLVTAFGASRVRIVDLNPDNIGTHRFGVRIGDGGTAIEALVRESDHVLVTGTTLCNGTFDAIRTLLDRTATPWMLYGVTAAGTCRLLDLPHFCPFAGRGQGP